MSKNLQKVQDMLDGNYKNKIQVGAIPDNVHANRKIGDKWTDSDGVEWEQKDGYRSKVSKLLNRGIFDRICKDCKSGITKPWDKDVHKADGRCYHCQIDYEVDLKADKPIRWFAYRRLKDFQNMESLEKDMVQWVEEFTKIQNEKVFDEKVANALANNEVEISINKNKLL
jgi:hypothetical protein